MEIFLDSIVELALFLSITVPGSRACTAAQVGHKGGTSEAIDVPVVRLSILDNIFYFHIVVRFEDFASLLCIVAGSNCYGS